MKLSQFLAPDLVTLDAAHGEHYHSRDRAENAHEASYQNTRDKKERDIVLHCMTDKDFAARCAAMDDDEWCAFLDMECGEIPGGNEDAEERRERRQRARNGRMSPFEVKAAQMIADGYETVAMIAAREGYPVYRIQQWINRGYKSASGEQVRLRTERIGTRMIFIRPEWYAEFLAGAPTCLWRAKGKRSRRGIMAKGDST